MRRGAPGAPFSCALQEAMTRAIRILLLLCLCGQASAEVYQEPADFLDEVFAGQTPEPQVLWLTGELRDHASAILGHPPSMLRVRYWAASGRSAWILEEIGKEEPITAGFVVAEGRLERVKVLVFRESRGWEIRHPFFTDQFTEAELTGDRELDRNIDGITGATLSVRAMKRLARLALYLDRQARDVAS